MIKYVLSLFLVLPLFSFAQSFPSLEIDHLDGTKESLPKDTKGKFTIIGIAFSQKAQKELESWIVPVYDNFITKEGLASMVYDVNPRLVLMFTGAKKAVVEKAKKKLSAGVDEEFKSKIGLWEGDFSTVKSDLSIQNKNTFYLFVLDKEGTIIHKESGMHTEKKMEKIGNLVEE